MGKQFSKRDLVLALNISRLIQSFNPFFLFFLILARIDPFSTSRIHSYNRVIVES